MPWRPEICQRYDAVIVASVDEEFRPLIAGLGFWPRALQKANVGIWRKRRRWQVAQCHYDDHCPRGFPSGYVAHARAGRREAVGRHLGSGRSGRVPRYSEHRGGACDASALSGRRNGGQSKVSLCRTTFRSNLASRTISMRTTSRRDSGQCARRVRKTWRRTSAGSRRSTGGRRKARGCSRRKRHSPMGAGRYHRCFISRVSVDALCNVAGPEHSTAVCRSRPTAGSDKGVDREGFRTEHSDSELAPA